VQKNAFFANTKFTVQLLNSYQRCTPNTQLEKWWRICTALLASNWQCQSSNKNMKLHCYCLTTIWPNLQVANLSAGQRQSV